MSKLQTLKYANHDEWLDLRRHYIGGSDAAAIIGENPYVSAYSVFLDKTGRVEPVEDNEAMRQGRDLEAYVAERFTEQTGKKVRRRNRILLNPDYPFAHANVDRWIVGENAGLECKTTTSLNLKRFKEGDYPANYYVQCMHYMAVTGADKYYLAVLVFGKGFYVYEIERDQDMIDLLMNEEERFWNYVQEDSPPPVDGSIPTDEAQKIMYPGGESESLDLGFEEYKVEKLLELKRLKKEFESEIRLKEQELKEFLGDNELAESARYKVTWKKYEREKFDFKRFKKDHPSLDLSNYIETSTYRTFRVNARKTD